VPTFTAVVLSIDPGYQHICVLDALGAVTCWGDNEDGQSSVPEGLEAIDVSAGRHHSCAVDTAGRVHCWGGDTYGQIQVPEDLEQVTQVAAGQGHTCALES